MTLASCCMRWFVGGLFLLVPDFFRSTACSFPLAMSYDVTSVVSRLVVVTVVAFSALSDL